MPSMLKIYFLFFIFLIQTNNLIQNSAGLQHFELNIRCSLLFIRMFYKLVVKSIHQVLLTHSLSAHSVLWCQNNTKDTHFSKTSCFIACILVYTRHVGYKHITRSLSVFTIPQDVYILMCIEVDFLR